MGPNVPLSTGTWEKVWKKESFLKHVKIWLPLRRTTRKSVWTLWREKAKKEKNTKLPVATPTPTTLRNETSFTYFNYFGFQNHSIFTRPYCFCLPFQYLIDHDHSIKNIRLFISKKK